jgi:caffeoyl-CoA O-methyltransferase
MLSHAGDARSWGGAAHRQLDEAQEVRGPRVQSFHGTEETVIRQEAVEVYLRTVRPRSDPLLEEMEGYAHEHRVPIADRETAALLAMLVRAAGARLVLEVGVAIGYTTLHLARALPAYGKVVALEVDMHMAALAKTYLARDPAGERVEILLGDARESMQALRESFDLVFVDADKHSYAAYVDLALPHLRRSGLLVLDNMLMDGRVAEGVGDSHWSQESVDDIRALNELLAGEEGLSYVLLPVGDGVGIVQRR